MTIYRVPRSRLWEAARDRLKPWLKRGPGASLYRWAARRYYWSRVFVNYALLRARWLRGRLRTGIWPQTIYIEGTNICNARCVFCAYPRMERPKTTMELEGFKDAVRQWVALGGDEVDLTPIVGDPFVDKHVFERLDFLAALPGVRRFHFYTNAVLMKPELHERLCGYGERLTVYNSFGGFDRETYHRVMGVDKFEAAVDNIRGLIETKRRVGSALNVQVNLRVPVGSEGGPFWDYLRAAAEAGTIVIDRVDAFDSWAGAIKEEDLGRAGLRARPMPLKRGACQRLVTGPTMLADGRVNACACRDVEANLVIGDLRSQPLDEVLSGRPLLELIDAHDRGELPEVCRRCTYYDSVYPRWLQGRLYGLVQLLLGRPVRAGGA